MKVRRVFFCAFFIAALVGCGSPNMEVDAQSGPDAGSLDAEPLGDDATLDALVDPLLDTRADAFGTDALRGDAGRPPTLAEVADVLCGALAELACTVPWDCACTDAGPRPDRGECIAEKREECGFSIAMTELGASITSGRMVVDLDVLRSCTAAARSGFERCSSTEVDFAVRCIRAFVDVAAIGERCTTAMCAEGRGFCDPATERCAPLPGMGASCFFACEDGLVCALGRCQPPAAAGAPCDRDASCADGLVCSGGFCRTLVARGGSCRTTSECAVGLVCAGGTCAPRASADCTDDSQCGSVEVCSLAPSEGRCRARGGIGEPCDVPESCAGRCDRSLGQCVPPGEVGAECIRNEECAEGLVCAIAGPTFRCMAPGRLGEACVEVLEGSGCAAGLACRSGRCGPLPGSGEDCGSSGECAEGLVCRDERGDLKCGAPRALGEPCRSNRECGSAGRCDWDTSRCAPRRTEGSPCLADDDCTGDLRCLLVPEVFELRCLPPIPVGERCESYGCVEGAYCATESTGSLCNARSCTSLPSF